MNLITASAPHRTRVDEEGEQRGGGRALHQIAFAGDSCLIALENIVMRWSKLSSSLMPIRLR